MEPFVAYFHYLGAIGMGCVLSSELFLFKQNMTYQEARRLQKVDLAYLGVVVLLLGTGFSRVFWYAKGQHYYFSNWLFTVKMIVFIIIGLLSIPPTVFYLKWKTDIQKKKPIQVQSSDYKKIRGLILAQLFLLPWLPLFAVFMARGFGISN